MTRTEFVKVCGLLGISIPLQPILSSCSSSQLNQTNNFKGKVLIIGGGAAGMASAYLLNQLGIDFQIIEASSSYGGRTKINTAFTDFPIPLGAEWLHTKSTELNHIVNKPTTQINIKTTAYKKDDIIGYYNNKILENRSIASEFGNYKDLKFINSSWFNFFETYIIPHIQSKFIFNTQIDSIDYSNKKIIASNKKGSRFEADKIIVTVPLKILQENSIHFNPQLPINKINAIKKANVWGGIKVFIEFSEVFYPTFISFPDSENYKGQRWYYNAAYGQNSSKNILGLFAVGEQAKPYQKLSGTELLNYILKELDNIFKGQASKKYIKHIVQNWNDEPFIKGAYLADSESYYISRVLSRSINNKIYFAGEAYTKERDWGGVHNATRSARDVVNEIISY